MSGRIGCPPLFLSAKRSHAKRAITPVGPTGPHPGCTSSPLSGDRTAGRLHGPGTRGATGRSQVEDEVLARLRAADERAAVGGVVDRGGVVADLSRHDG